MFFRLAIKNVQRSIKDYMVYFLTLMLAVCIFYMFNSLDAQMVMLDLASEGNTASNTIVALVKFLSVVMAIVLVFLVIYANGFIMKRRKREFGLYMTLGISNRKIAGMLATETIVIGILALAAGLVCGYFASQGMSVLTARIFEVNITNYHFIFSKEGMLMTCVCFAIIFVLVMLLNLINVSRLSLAQLLSAGKTNQKVPVRRKGTAILATTAGVIVIALSYWLVFAMGFGAMMVAVLPAVLVNFAGTALLLFGLSGLVLSGRHTSARYYTGLRMFTTRQLASQVTTNVLSMSVICTLLFLTLVIVSTTSTINSVINRETEGAAPFDVSFTTVTQDPAQNTPVRQAMAESGIGDDLFSQMYDYPLYQSDVLQGQICTKPGGYTEEAWERISSQPVDAVAVSDFNVLLQMQGLPPIQLADDTFAINVTLQEIQKALEPYMENPQPITIAGTELKYGGIPANSLTLWTSRSSSEVFTLIVPDAIASLLGAPVIDVCVADFAGDRDVAEQILSGKADQILAYQETSPTGTAFRMALASSVQMQNKIMNATMTFVGLYIGMVFLVAGAAVIALQTLTGASDDRDRYALLRKIGADRKMIGGAVFSTVAAYFAIPLVLAAIHSIFGITYMIQGMGVLGFDDILSGSVLVALLICAVYGVYFALTYATCRSIINTKETRRTE